MKWQDLLSSKRQKASDPMPAYFDQYPISEFEKDYLSIVTSSAFRRLQDKTQVFPLDKSDFVRTRLTHSMEVSTIARQLGIMITQNTTAYQKDDFKNDPEICRDLPIVLSCAGLLHDLGNPPFGHFGESVIRKWFEEKLQDDHFAYKGKKIGDILTDQMKMDLVNFEGNAQALRILSKRAQKKIGYDMNLTYAVMNTLVKYPTDSLHFSKKDPDVKKHKPGYYYSERKIMEQVAETTGTKTGDEYVRHPLVYLMEASDDIAYATADLEDALKKGFFTLDEFMTYYREEMEKVSDEKAKQKEKTGELYAKLEASIEGQLRSPGTDLIYFEHWIEYVRKMLMYSVAYCFSLNYDSIMDGTFQKDMFEDTYAEQTISILKRTMAYFVYDADDILLLEISAKKIVGNLLDELVPAVLYYKEDDPKYKPSLLDDRLIRILPAELRADYRSTKTDDEAENLYRRFLIVTDYISGMTDSFAKNLYQEMNGLK